MTSHFAHVDASKCNSESQIHFWFKYKFIEKGDTFTVTSDKERDYVCKDILVEKEYETDNVIYRPDVTVLTKCGNTIYFEMAFSNKKKVKDYLDIWLELKNIVVEVDIKHLINIDSLPTFKALFYEGKCFNTKRNDTYYNTIGKYKEEKLKGKFDEELKERIRKLDWFWDDVFRYKKGETDIEQITNLIDNIDEKEKEIALRILSKKSCNEIYKDYLNYKQKYLYEVLRNKFDFNNEYYSIAKSGFVSSWYDKYLTKKIEFKNIIEKEYSSLDIRKLSTEEIIESIRKSIISIERTIKHKENLEFAKSNQVLNSVIKRIEDECKKIDERYRFHDRFCYSHIVSLHYNCN